MNFSFSIQFCLFESMHFMFSKNQLLTLPKWPYSAVANTFASHAKDPEFEPRSGHSFSLLYDNQTNNRIEYKIDRRFNYFKRLTESTFNQVKKMIYFLLHEKSLSYLFYFYILNTISNITYDISLSEEVLLWKLITILGEGILN